MDSIERMRRLNELTKELKQRGFAESSFEAIQQANQIYGDDDLTSEVKQGMIRNSHHDFAESSGDVMEESSMINIEKKINKVSENVNTLTEKMNEIIKAINDMDSRINALKNKPVERVEKSAPPSVHVEEKTEHKAEPQEAPVDIKKDEYSTNQRTGSFQSQDVAIDKMFYFGKK
jgi:hypothetical protein